MPYSTGKRKDFKGKKDLFPSAKRGGGINTGSGKTGDEANGI